MKELYKKGVATHFGPESCVCVRKEVCEALTGEFTGTVLNHEISLILRSRRQSFLAEGNMGASVIASVSLSLRGPRPVAREEAYRAEVGRSRHRTMAWGCGALIIQGVSWW
jgi:hypothetical protein